MPNEQTIKCPNCAEEIPLTDALTHQMEEQVRRQVTAEQKQREDNLAKQTEELQNRQKEMAKKQREMDEQISAQVAKKLHQEKLAMWEKAQKEATEKARQEQAATLKQMREEATEKDKKLQQMQQAELDLRKEKQALAEKQRELELETARKIDAERKKIEEAAHKRLTEEQRLKDAEKDKQLNDLRRQIEEWKHKAEQGSQQTQGEVLELELEQFLQQQFPHDTIEEVPKGINGADVLQRIVTTGGKQCGTIAWESKRAKNWSEKWVEKLKADQREVGAEIAVIISQTLPAGINSFGQHNGVWVCDYTSMAGMAQALRAQVVQVANAKQVAVNQKEKQSVLYEYATSTEFRHRVEAILESFMGMKETLEKERRSTQLRWAKQEKLIRQMIDNTAGMYGDFSALLGPAIQSIPALETGEEETEETDEL